jgi:UDP-sugar diphosphatase
VYVSLRSEAAEAGLPPPPLSAAFTYELCAGIVDKEKTLEEIAHEEVGMDSRPSHFFF